MTYIGCFGKMEIVFLFTWLKREVSPKEEQKKKRKKKRDEASCRCVVAWYQGTVYHKVCVFIDVHIVHVKSTFAFIQGGESERTFICLFWFNYYLDGSKFYFIWSG